jgi:5,10-methylenetetrahydrofolate reductase
VNQIDTDPYDPSAPLEALPGHSSLGRLERILRRGEFAVTAELNPPDSANPHDVYERAAIFDGWVDGINAVDASGANAHMSSVGICALLSRMGYASILQISCRDKNRIAIQGDVLGAAAMGVWNVLCLTGDGVQAGDQPGAKPVFDLDCMSLLETIRTMRDESRFLSGRKLTTAGTCFMGAAINPFAPPQDFRVHRLAKKIAAGAQFVQSQYCYDVMTRTIVASATKEVVIGFDQPFCVIGERINPTGRKKLAAEMVEGNFETVKADALAQVAAGATMLDVNAGVTSVNPNETEPRLLVKHSKSFRDWSTCRLSIDSARHRRDRRLPAGRQGPPAGQLGHRRRGKARSHPAAGKKYDVPVVAISNDETGISEDPDVRFAVAKKIVERAADYGIKPHDIVVDPLVMPIGAMGTAGQQVFALLRRLREELGSTPPAASPTSPSACPTATASMPASSRW